MRCTAFFENLAVSTVGVDFVDERRGPSLGGYRSQTALPEPDD
jgi:hypothetical protein